MNSLRKPFALLLAPACLVLAAVTAFAQAGVRSSPAVPPVRQPGESPVSSNAPGRTGGSGTIKEINAQQFEAIDRDNDNHINLTEFTSSPILRGDVAAAATGQAPTVAAPRSDGTVLIKPAPGRNTPEHFRRLDKDRDGYLDSIEIAAYYLSELED